ncbi:hypothetical protein [Bacillus haynesii]|nr:hypothetical protein [Bacillus haynesii]
MPSKKRLLLDEKPSDRKNSAIQVCADREELPCQPVSHVSLARSYFSF